MKDLPGRGRRQLRNRRRHHKEVRRFGVHALPNKRVPELRDAVLNLEQLAETAALAASW